MRPPARKKPSPPSPLESFDFNEEIFRDDLGRRPDQVRIKHERMAANPFDYFRGSAASFHRLWARLRPVAAAPVGWVCGDPHWNNAGSYRGRNRVAYFDLTDFDHACLAPLEADVGRALTAYHVIRRAELAPVFLAAYRRTLLGGKPSHIEREVAKGQVGQLLDRVWRRRRKSFLAVWTEGGRIRTIDGRTFRVSGPERTEALKTFRRWAAAQRDPEFYRILDLCGSQSGLGALGLRRYLVLVQGGRRPHLIDMKEASASALAAARPLPQPSWRCEAERVATVQQHVQYMPIAHLGWVRARRRSFILTDFQPAEDRIRFATLPKEERASFTRRMGRLVAWSHLRAASWKGAAGVDALMAYAAGLTRPHFHALLRAAGEADQTITRSHAEFQALIGPAA